VFHVKRQGWRCLIAAFMATSLLLGSLNVPTVAFGTSPPPNRPQQNFVPGVLLARPEPGVATTRIATLIGAREGPPVAPGLGVQKFEVQPGHEQTSVERLRRSGLVAGASLDYIRHVAVVPDDPDYPDQWDLPKIDAPGAWQTTLGSSSTTVAVIDSGYDFGHPDRPTHLIAGPTYTSTAAADGCPPEGIDGPQDDLGHGTHVAGTIAAGFDNGIGVAGLAPNVSVLIVKAADCTGNLADSDVVAAIEYAADHGASVINMSFGGPEQDDILDQAVEDAWSKGVVLVAAAGNQSSSAPFYPAWSPDVMAVSATDQNDSPAWFSNYGPDIAVAAPGVNILSTVPSFDNATGYAAESGTSMAAPHVSATAALVLSAAPGLTNVQVVQAIERGAVSLGPGCPNPYYGYGRVDVAAALAMAQAMVPSGSLAPQSLANRVFLPFVTNGACSLP